MSAVNESNPPESKGAPESTAAVVRRARRQPRPASGGRARPARILGSLVIVAGLIGTVGLSAYGAYNGANSAAADNKGLTLQQAAADGAQALVVASDVTGDAVQRDAYAATTAAEIAQKKAEEEALRRAQEAAAAAEAAKKAAADKKVSIDFSNVPTFSGATGTFVWPVTGFVLGDTLGAGRGHEGSDLLIAAGTPIYAMNAGTVTISAESYGGYGNFVEITGDVNGTSVESRYGHMTSGSRVVSEGDHVEAGQLIGLVGSTGRSTANHLHLEVRLDGSLVDSYAFLVANAG